MSHFAFLGMQKDSFYLRALRAFVKQEKETLGKEVVYARTIIENWRLAVATSGRQLQLQFAGASTERAGKCISNCFNQKKNLWGELAIFKFGGPRIKISCIKFVEDWHPDAQCMAYLSLFAPPINYPNVSK